ncbi:MAG: hypothetical protein LBL24_03500 [Bacteroidales bacterium]|nr:hypothetical protein [Bacteroidales bacterium]
MIQPGDLPVRINSHRDDAERDRIVKALEHCRFSKTDTAQYMGISRKTLFNKMKRYGLE